MNKRVKCDITDKEKKYVKNSCNNYPIIIPFNGNLVDIVKDLKQINRGNNPLKDRLNELSKRVDEIEKEREQKKREARKRNDLIKERATSYIEENANSFVFGT